MKFQTVSGSLYEVDEDNKQLRRLNGVKDPTPRMGKDGEWRKYANLFPDPIQVGERVLIQWGDDVSLLEETAAMLEEGQVPLKTTITSTVKVINPLEN